VKSIIAKYVLADAYTGNLRGAGPATVALPFAVRKNNPSQTVLVSFADKTEPMAFNHYAIEIVDLDTKAQAIEAGAHPRDPKALDGKMEEMATGLQEKVITLRAPEDLYDIEGLTRSARFVVARIWTRDDQGQRDQLGYVCSVERLHARGVKQPATLHEDELEYQEGWRERRARLERQFEVKPALTFGNGHGHGTHAPAPTASRAGRPEEID
jgi:fructose 1,6-bisphosphatase